MGTIAIKTVSYTHLSLVFVPNTQPDQIPELNSFLEEWGMSVGSGVMFELSTDHLYNNTTCLLYTSRCV